MADKKLTDEEIIKSLKFCEDCSANINIDIIDLIDLINRQKAELADNERLNKKVEKLSEVLSDTIRIRCTKVKAEAYKEFAGKVKQEIKEAYDNNIEVLNERLEKHRGCFNDTFVGMIEGKNNALLGLSDFIDNLLKEMVGDMDGQ